MHRYRHEPPQPQPLSWPTGLLLDAPPEPKPWRRTAIMSRRQQRDLGWTSAVLSGNSTGTFGASAAGDDTSSQESSVADWQTVDSEDGETSVGSGSGVGGVGAARGGGGGASAVAVAGFDNYNNHLTGRRPDSFASRETGGGGGGGGAAAAACSGSGGSNAPGVSRKQHDPDDAGCAAAATGIGGASLLAPSRQHTSRTDGRSAGGVQETTGGAACPRERLPPLAPIPRVGAFPAQHRVHGTEGLLRGSGGSRKAEVRAAATTTTIVHPYAQAFRPSRPSTVEEGPMVPAPAAPPAARAEAKAGCVAADSTTSVSEMCRREEASNATPADAIGGACPSRPAGEEGSEVSKEGSTTLQEDAAGGEDPVIASNEEKTTPAAVIGGGTRCGAAAAAGAGAAEAESSSNILGRRGLAPCASATVVSSKVTVRQWRRLFLP
ncbi:unnamed protein product [Ectocarpus sp. CCAP 1310/34]|nr:unnamed protein product [Ectocarpus sp. CCAP 1310/34]